MAKETEGKAKKVSRQVKDAGQRQVFVGLPMSAKSIATLLAEEAASNELSDKDRAAAVERVSKMLSVEEGEKCIVWVPVGNPVDGSPTKRDAVDAVVGADRPGRYRAPTSTAWRGEIRRTPPKQIALDEEIVD